MLILVVLLLHDNRSLELRRVPFQTYLSVGTAGISVILALLFMPQNDYFFRYCVVDLILCILWFTCFSLLLTRSKGPNDVHGCGQTMKQFGQIAMGGSCNSWRATWGFAFLSGCMWLGTFLVGLWVVSRSRKKKGQAGKQAGGHNR